MRFADWQLRVYRLLLRLYPRWFRDAYGSEMIADFSELFQQSGSRWKTLACWYFVLCDLTCSLPRQWSATLRQNHDRGPKLTPGENMFGLLSDFSFAFRVLAQYRGFSLLVVGTLALGVGTNVAMFSVVDSVLLSPLPYEDAQRLVMVWNRHTATGADKVQVSGPDFVDLRLRTTLFEDFAYIHNSADNTLTGDGPAEQIDVGFVSTNFFQFLGREPFLGRAFVQTDENRGSSGLGGEAPAVISHGLWVRRYGADPGIVGGKIYIAGRAMEVVGVMAPDFELVLPYSDVGYAAGEGTQIVDVWRVLSERSVGSIPRSTAILRVLARLAPGATFTQAQQEMDALAQAMRNEHRLHAERRTSIDLVSMHADVVGEVKPVVLSLFGAVGFVLLIACANVANLVLVRAANRRREISIRVALGASRGRLVRQLLVENAVLAIGGAVVGVLLAKALIGGIVWLAPSNVPMLAQVGIDTRVLTFALGVTVLAMLLFGLWPTLRGTRVAVHSHLNEVSRKHGRGGHRLHATIVTMEVALSLVLLVGGGLLVRSFLELQRARLGFEPESALTAIVAMPHGAYDDAAVRENYWNTLRREANEASGVNSAGLVWPLPFASQGADAPYAATGAESEDWGRHVATIAAVSPGYFETMNARLVEGRTLAESDLQRAERIAIVDDLVAKRLFPGESAIGRTVWIQPLGSEEKQAREIIGVVAHIRHTRIVGPDREVIHIPDASGYRMALVVRTRAQPVAALSELRRVAAAIDPAIPLFDARAFREYLEDEIAPTRFTMTLASAFALIALMMAAVGLYGVVSYAVTQRAAELGVRVALGADETTIVRLIIRDGATMAVWGIIIGLVASLGVTRTTQSLLVGVEPTDPITMAVVSLILGFVTLVATYLPARRAARLDPLAALREH